MDRSAKIILRFLVYFLRERHFQRGKMCAPPPPVTSKNYNIYPVINQRYIKNKTNPRSIRLPHSATGPLIKSQPEPVALTVSQVVKLPVSASKLNNLPVA